jgi:hypothetical protein
MAGGDIGNTEEGPITVLQKKRQPALSTVLGHGRKGTGQTGERYGESGDYCPLTWAFLRMSIDTRMYPWQIQE